MTKLITIPDISFLSSPEWAQDKTRYCKELEVGNILFFPTCPIPFPQDDLDFLLSQKQTGATHRKNIAYKPSSNKITNFVHSSPEQSDRLLAVMKSYSFHVISLLRELLAPYSSQWKLDYASFRPFQEKGRALRTRARNDLLHVDAFPSRPMHGGRILRFFTNINPKESRCWTTSDPFPLLAKRFGGKDVPFPSGITGSPLQKLSSLLKKTAKQCKLPVTLRSPYDTFMLELHNFLKENTHFQETCPKNYFEFPPTILLDCLHRPRVPCRNRRTIRPRANPHHPSKRHGDT